MRIALDATYSLGRNLSGVGTYSRELMHGLAAAHREDRFLYYYRPHRFLRAFKEPIPSNARRRPLLDSAPGPIRADLFHALNQRVDRGGRCTVSTFHDLFVISGDYSTPEFRERFAQQARQAAERSDRIIAVSEFTAHQVETLLGVPRSNIRVVPHGVRVPPSPATEIRRENLILFVGAVQRRKNVARLIEAMRGVPAGWRLVLAGATTGYHAQQELAGLDAHPRRGDIDVPGYVSSDQLEALYRRASIFAFPSLDEGFGIPVLDAMARGVPVVTSNRSALPEVAGDAAILIDPENMDELVDALQRLIADPALRGELAERGRVRAEAFSWESAVARTWEVYRELGIS